METALAKTILTKSKHSDQWFASDYGCNLYRGCSHGCIYCDSRSECYHIDSFSHVKPKKDALTILEKELSKKRKKGVIGTGAMSDPYNPLEKKLELTRGLLQLADRYHFGVIIYTKSTLVTRDIDLLKKINEHSSVVVCMTITTFDDTLSKIIEPYAPSSSQRFEALKKLKEANILAGIILMPILPWINDQPQNIKAITQKSSNVGVDFIYPFFGVTLRDRQRDYFYDRLDIHFPILKSKYQHYFKNSYACHCPENKKLYSLLKDECKKFNIPIHMKEIVSLYKKEKEQFEILSFDF